MLPFRLPKQPVVRFLLSVLVAVFAVSEYTAMSGYVTSDGSGCCIGGGGGPPSGPTPDPYAWIRALPLYGQTSTNLSQWKVSGFSVWLNLYGVVSDPATVVNPSIEEGQLGYVYIEMEVQSQESWTWSGFSIWDTIQSNSNFVAGITIDLSCPTLLPPPPSNFLRVAGCNDNFGLIDVGGINGKAHFQPNVEVGGDVIPVANYYIDYAHRLF